MNPAVIALLWLAGGVLSVFLPRSFRLRRLAFVIPALLGIVTVTQATGTHNAGIFSGNGDLVLTRGDGGMIALAGVAAAVLILIAPQSTVWDVLFMCVAGAAATLMLSAQSPLLFGAVTLAVIFVISVHWVSIQPERATLAAGRVPAAGAALILAAAAFMPVSPYVNSPRAEFLAAVVILGAITMTGCVFGWLHASLSTLPAATSGPWPFFVLPAILLNLMRMPPSFPSDAFILLLHWLLIAGLASAVWNAINSITAAPEQRYSRVLLADISLFVAAIGTNVPAAQSGALLILICHLMTAPLLLQRPEGPLRRQRIFGWIVMSGLPLLPSFWGRFLVLQGAASVSNFAALACAVAIGFLFIAAIRVFTARRKQDSAVTRENLRPMLAWFPVIASAAFGVAPALIAGLILGAWS